MRHNRCALERDTKARSHHSHSHSGETKSDRSAGRPWPSRNVRAAFPRFYINLNYSKHHSKPKTIIVIVKTSIQTEKVREHIQKTRTNAYISAAFV